MKKKKSTFPRAILKKFVTDIKKLILDNEGRIFILEILEEIPSDLRSLVLESLSSFYEPEMVDFYHLLKAEYGKEVETICDRTLGKYSMAGMDTQPHPFFTGTFYRAYVSKSRHTGRIALDIAWHIDESSVHVECFYLVFNSDGIHSFFVVENMPVRQFDQDRENLTEMMELDFNEVCFLISQAYRFNLNNMSRPALGRFLYQKYLNHGWDLSNEMQLELTRRLSNRMTPRQVVNSFFHAWRDHDSVYIDSLIDWNTADVKKVKTNIDQMLTPGLILVEGQVEEVFAARTFARVNTRTIAMDEGECCWGEYIFYLTKDSHWGWRLRDIELLSNKLLSSISECNPFNNQVYARVYEIVDLDDLFEALDRLDNIREVEELPYGLHMRVTSNNNDLTQGVSLLTSVMAELVINADEFVIISSNYSTLLDLHHLLLGEPGLPVVSRGEYEVTLMTVYSYLSGQYLNFEDLLLAQEDDLVFEDGMRFISTRYLVKDRERVLNRLQKLKTMELGVTEDWRIFYQMESNHEASQFLVEYILGPGWVTLSTFGEHDMIKARKVFEESMQDCLEFDGMAVRGEGLFDILTTEVKREHPNLENNLKEMYLNKWYHSELVGLRGMSPSEASKTEEGSRLLWAMYKKIKKKENNRFYQGQSNRIQLREYIRTVEQKKEGQQ